MQELTCWCEMGSVPALRLLRGPGVPGARPRPRRPGEGPEGLEVVYLKLLQELCRGGSSLRREMLACLPRGELVCEVLVQSGQ